jgi:hypothetical protein
MVTPGAMILMLATQLLIRLLIFVRISIALLVSGMAKAMLMNVTMERIPSQEDSVEHVRGIVEN